MTFAIRKHGINRTQKFLPATVAFITREPWPDGTSGFEKWWHRYSLWSGHVHAKWGYSVEHAAEQLGVDADSLRRHYGIGKRYSWMEAAAAAAAATGNGSE